MSDPHGQVKLVPTNNYFFGLRYFGHEGQHHDYLNRVGINFIVIFVFYDLPLYGDVYKLRR